MPNKFKEIPAEVYRALQAAGINAHLMAIHNGDKLELYRRAGLDEDENFQCDELDARTEFLEVGKCKKKPPKPMLECRWVNVGGTQRWMCF
jgi:hypothetical protein